MDRKEAVNLNEEYIVFDAQGHHARWQAADFWKAAFAKDHPAIHPDMGSLVSRYSFDADWNSWERHPNGDELVYLTKGSVTFIIESPEDTRVHLKAGDAFVIPKGRWHTAKIHEPSEALFITFGYGTEHKPIE